MTNSQFIRTLLLIFVVSFGAVGQACAGGKSDTQLEEGARFGGSYQKPGAPVRFDHNYDGSTELAEQEIVDLYIIPEFDIDKLDVKVLSTSQILAGREFDYSAAAKGSEPVLIPVTVSSNEAGRFYINIHVTSEANGAISTRSFALPITVGDVPKKKSKATFMGDGERVRMMDAEETVQ